MKLTDAFLKRLIEVCRPPSRRHHTGRLNDFDEVERELSLELPFSFKELTRAYGSGLWFETIWLLNPFFRSPRSRQRWWCPRGYTGGPEWCDSLRTARGESSTLDSLYPIDPEPGGLFPWAFLQDGGVLYWLTEGPSDSWKTFDDRDMPGSEDLWEVHEMSVTELLFRVASDDPLIWEKEVYSRCLPYRDHGFTPFPWR
jgi:hypothetical protein